MENGKRIRVLTVKYTADIDYHEIPLFRGAVIASMNHEADVLFHNHIDNGKFRYSYPLIQYKRIGGKAAIVFINDAILKAQNNLSFENIEMTLGKRMVSTSTSSIDAQETEIIATDHCLAYKLTSWIPLNNENHKAFNQCYALVDKLELLQNILTGNIISMAKGLGIEIDKQIEVIITDYQRPKKITSKGIDLLSFDIEFMANITLPENIGLGKSVSKGHGIVNKK